MTTTQGSASQQTPTQSQVQVGTTPTATRRAMLGLGLGNTLEWYDWMIFGLLAALIGPQFFAARDPVSRHSRRSRGLRGRVRGPPAGRRAVRQCRRPGWAARA